MRSSLFLSLLATASTVLGAPRDLHKKAPKYLSGAYLFEFEDNGDQELFYSKVGSDGKPRLRLDYKLFKGVSIQFDDVENAEDKANKLAALPAVKEVWPVVLYSAPSPKVEWIGSPEKEYAGSKRKRAANETSEDTFSPHVMTQVDKLRAEGYTGKGIKVAVVDTGIDYKHPALGGCFGPDCLVSFGTDLVGDAYTGFNEAVPDKDPMDCAGHGTHVAGIIAAQENSFGFTGAAPDVTLGAYKVFGCAGEAGNDVLIASFNQAWEDGADIITSSVGGASGWTEDAWAVAVSRIVDQGVPCTVSAGNSGDEGLFYASTAANGKGVAAIASFDNSHSPSLLTIAHYAVDNGTKNEFGYTPAEPADWAGVKLPLWAPSYDPADPEGGCDPYPEDTPDLGGYIVLIRRGSCTFVAKAQNAADAGAHYIIIYNNAVGAANFDVSTVEGIRAAGMVDAEQGKQWISLLADGKQVVLELEDPDESDFRLVETPNNVTGGALSTYTSWGPTWEMDVKPQFGAPGGNILSTYPTALGSYAVLSGTSMSCPLTAAVYALIGQVRGTFDPELIEDLLSANANPQLFNDGEAYYSYLAPVPQQGGGLIRAHDAAHATTLLSPSSLSFNDTDHFVATRNFTLQNKGSEAITYEIFHVPAATMYTLADGQIYPGTFPNEVAPGSASVNFSEAKFTLEPGHRRVVEVLPTAPADLDAARLPLWSGYVTVNGSDGTSLSLPYQGLTGSLRAATVLAPAGDAWIARSTDRDPLPVPANTTFRLPPPGTAAGANGTTLPTLVTYLALGTSTLHADIVPVSGAGGNATADVGEPANFPLRWLPRGLNALTWDGELANGDYVEEGTYKIVFRALHVFGDAKNKEDWDVSETDPFSIVYRKF